MVDFTYFMVAFILSALAAGICVRVVTVRRLRARGAYYDERQQLMQGRAYTFGFQVMCLVGFCYMFANFLFPVVPIEPNLAIFVMIMLGITAASCYKIFNHSFFTLGQRGTIYTIVLVIVMIQQAWLSYVNITQGDVMENGVLTFSGCVPVVLTLIFAAIAGLLLVMAVRGHREE